MGVPKNGWFIVEDPVKPIYKWMIWGYPYLWKKSTWVCTWQPFQGKVMIVWYTDTPSNCLRQARCVRHTPISLDVGGCSILVCCKWGPIHSLLLWLRPLWDTLHRYDLSYGTDQPMYVGLSENRVPQYIDGYSSCSIIFPIKRLDLHLPFKNIYTSNSTNKDMIH